MPALGIHSSEVSNLHWSSLKKQYPDPQDDGGVPRLSKKDSRFDTKVTRLPPSEDSLNGNVATHAIKGVVNGTSSHKINGASNGALSYNVNGTSDGTTSPSMNGNGSVPLDDNQQIRLAPQTRYITQSCLKAVSGKLKQSQPFNDPSNERPALTSATKPINQTPVTVNDCDKLRNGSPPPPSVSSDRAVCMVERPLSVCISSSTRPRKAGCSPDIATGNVPTPPTSLQLSRCKLPDLAPFQTSYRGVSESAGAWGDLGHYNILHVTTRDPGQHWFTRYCCYLVHCYRLRVNFTYPDIHNKVILQDERIQHALEQVVSESEQKEGSAKAYKASMAKQVARANTLLDNMKAAISTTLIRLTGYVLFKVFSRLLTSVVVHKGQLEAIQRASKKGTPLIFVPLHRSHVDYLFVTWVLFNCQIPAPIVAAGDNLNMPVFGALLRGTGGFFIKRRLESNKARKDVLYRALLQCYMSHMLHAGYNLEFFIEGGRTRTGKPAMPKGGLLSVILDAYLSGMLDDALVVPVAINYDKLVDGNFIREQLGQSKVPESFWGAVCAICKVLSTSYGQSRIDFGAPFSLREFVQRSRFHQLNPGAAAAGQLRGHHRSLSSPVSANHLTARRVPSTPSTALDGSSSPDNIQPAMSNSSLFGTELTDEFRQLVKKLGQHIVFDAERCQAMMSSNLVAWVSSFMHRDGASLATLTAAVSGLRDALQQRGRDVGFTGDTRDVVEHAIRLLGPSLIQSEVCSGEVLYRPVTVLPNVIELNYYANALLPVFALDAIVATSVQCVLEFDLASYVDCDTDITLHLDKVMRCSMRLCDLLCHEFVLVAPCGQLSSKLLDVVDRLQVSGLLTESKSHSRRRQQQDSWLDEEGAESDASADSDAPVYNIVYKVSPSPHSLRYLTAFVRMLTPLLDAYAATFECLQQLVAKQMLEKDLVMKTQELMRSKLAEGSIIFGESIAADPIKNCIKMLEGERVLESFQQDSNKLVYLSKAYDSVEALLPLLDSINAVRV